MTRPLRRLGFAADVAVRLAVVVVFALLVARFWHPAYGFTRFLEVDAACLRDAVPALRAIPVWIHGGEGSYDGIYYAQIAADPTLRDPALRGLMDNLPYRGSRILLPALSHAAALGDPAWSIQVYAAANVVVWLAWAAVLWALLPPGSWRRVVAWTSLVLAAGALHSVRLALTDLLAATLVAGALLAQRRGRPGLGLVQIAIGGLARDTALLGVIVLWQGPWGSPGAWLRNTTRTALAALPLGGWLLYERVVLGEAVLGGGNLGWPLLGWLLKARETAAALATASDRALALTTLLAFVGLTLQAWIALRRVDLNQPASRLAAGFALLAIALGFAVWEGHPGAATRVLLPLGVAVALLATERRHGFAPLLALALVAPAGVLALARVPDDPARATEVAAARREGTAVIVRVDARWFGPETDGRRTWRWAAGPAGLVLETWPADAGPLSLDLELRAFRAAELTVTLDARPLWRGPLGERRQIIPLEGITVRDGRATLELALDRPAAPEGEGPGARRLGFAVFAARLRAAGAP